MGSRKIIFLFLVVANLFAGEYEDWLKSQQSGFNNYKKTLEEEFEAYKKAYDDEFKVYKKSLSKYWGNDPEVTTKKKFVEYSKDLKEKKVVDFEKKEIKLEVIANDKKEAQEKLKNMFKDLSKESVSKAYKRDLLEQRVAKKLKLKTKVKSSNPIVADIITKKEKRKVYDKIKYSIKQTKKNGKIIFSVSVKMPKNSILKKAKAYKNYVKLYSAMHQLPKELVYAIIETESSFNPLARSYIPAFGLMQLVPRTAGIEAYKKVYGKKKLVTASFLYNEKNNINLGSAYLNILYYGYLRRIKNPLSRLYCTIAAYNTGAGNVACAFNSNKKDYKGRTICKRREGDYNIVKASKKINQYSPSEVYNKLLANLRYEEPKHYLKRVFARMKKYKLAISKGEL